MKRNQSVRLVPDEPFPPYAYIPTRFPHPVRDPKGHSYGEKRDGSIFSKILKNEKNRTVPFPNWCKCRPYLYGIDLFNHGYYWEAHDAWESVWLACGRKGVTADFLKGLIKLAAAGVKAREGRKRRVQQQAKRAEELFRQVTLASGSRKSRYMGLSLTQLIGFANRLRHTPVAVTSNDPVKVVFRFKLRPLV
ncbi:MAG: DUF309 domain-containing protein [Candidatus Omnitrophica bacterium]|nr:DUF309 domain-containing protein [Candidatus Omnitrophota bacterium]